ncbi:hypothetical protein CRUP_013383 [Coryphaenoides rupestris]|nr:hypothetical protein CRUP_013383 [Coryphaenoides rupestris]
MAMPCLSAIFRGSPPDYVDASISAAPGEAPPPSTPTATMTPRPSNTSNVSLPEKLEYFANKYGEHSHDKWSAEKVLLGWKYGECVDEKAKTHPQLRMYKGLTEKEKEIYRWPIRESLRSMLAMGWNVDRTKDGESISQQRESEKMRKISQASQANGFNPSPIDTSKVVLWGNTPPAGALRHPDGQGEGGGQRLRHHQVHGSSLLTEIKFFAKVSLSSAKKKIWIETLKEASRSSSHLGPLPQVLLPLIDQYFKNHSLYFLSSPNKNLSSSGYASHKEKEMVTRSPVLHIISIATTTTTYTHLTASRSPSPRSDSTTMVSCLHILAHTLDTRTVMKSGSEPVKAGLRTFFENAAEDLERTFENLKLGKFTHSRSQMKGVSQNINYTTAALLPILTALFQHITQHHFGADLLLDDVQVSCYRILNSLYALGTGKNIYVERQLPALGECLATLAGALPVAFLEPQLNAYNPCSVFNTKSARERASESCGQHHHIRGRR